MITLKTATYTSGGTGIPKDWINPLNDNPTNMAVDGSATPAIFDGVNDQFLSGAVPKPVYLAQMHLSFLGTNVRWNTLGNSTAHETQGMEFRLLDENLQTRLVIAKFRANVEISGSGIVVIQDAGGLGLMTANISMEVLFGEKLLLQVGWRLRMIIDADLTSNTLVRGVISGRITPSHANGGLG